MHYAIRWYKDSVSSPSLYSDLRRWQITRLAAPLLSIRAADYFHNSNTMYRHNVMHICCVLADRERRKRTATNEIAGKERAFPFPPRVNFVFAGALQLRTPIDSGTLIDEFFCFQNPETGSLRVRNGETNSTWSNKNDSYETPINEYEIK